MGLGTIEKISAEKSVSLCALLIVIAAQASVILSVPHNIASETPQIAINDLPSDTAEGPYDVSGPSPGAIAATPTASGQYFSTVASARLRQTAISTVSISIAARSPGATTNILPERIVQEAYDAVLTASGLFSGISTHAGPRNFTAQLNDLSSPFRTATQAPTVTIGPASNGSGNPIPSSLFGITITYNRDWPTVAFGDLSKGTLVRWPYIEQTKGVYNWSNLDSWVSVANAHNMPFQYSSTEAPPWAVSDQTSCSAIEGGKACSADVTDLTGWNQFVTALTQRYNGNNGHGFIGVYELYNEPEGFFKGHIANLVAQTVALYKAVRSNSPNSLVVGMGVTNPDTYYAPGNYMDTYWTAGGVKTLDVVAFHGYPHHFDDVPEIVNTFAPYVKAAMARNGIPANTPIWDTEGSWGDVTENGWNVTDPVEQAAWVARSYLLHWSNGVSVFDWYSWEGYPWGALWDASGGIHKAGIAYGQVYNWMVGATMTAPCVASGTVWTCGLTPPGSSQALAVWNTSGASTYVPATQYTKYRDLAGNTSAITGSSVAIGIEPILLEK